MKAATLYDIIKRIYNGKKDKLNDFHHLSKEISRTKMGSFYLRKDLVVTISRFFCIARSFLGSLTPLVISGAGKAIDFLGTIRVLKNYPSVIGKALDNIQKMVLKSGTKYIDGCMKLAEIPDNSKYLRVSDAKIAIPTEWDVDGNWLDTYIEKGEFYLEVPVKLIDLIILLDFIASTKLLDLGTVLSDIGIFDESLYDNPKKVKKCGRKGKLSKEDYSKFKTFGDLLRDISKSGRSSASNRGGQYTYCITKRLKEVPLEKTFMRMDFVILIARLFCILNQNIGQWGTRKGLEVTRKAINRTRTTLERARRAHTLTTDLSNKVIGFMNEKLGKNIRRRNSITSDNKLNRYLTHIETALSDISKFNDHADVKFNKICSKVKEYPKLNHYFERQRKGYNIKMLLPNEWDADGNVTKYIVKDGDYYFNYPLNIPSLIYLLDIAVYFEAITFNGILQMAGLLAV